MYVVVERSGRIFVVKKNHQDTTFESYSSLWAVASHEPNHSKDFEEAEKKARQYLNQSLYDCQYGSEEQDDVSLSLEPKKMYSTW